MPNAFQDFGWVQLYVTNNRDIPATVLDFEVVWGPWEDREESGTVALQRITVGGANASAGQLLWAAPSDAGVGITPEAPVIENPTVGNPNTYLPGYQL